MSSDFLDEALDLIYRAHGDPVYDVELTADLRARGHEVPHSKEGIVTVLKKEENVVTGSYDGHITYRWAGCHFFGARRSLANLYAASRN